MQIKKILLGLFLSLIGINSFATCTGTTINANLGNYSFSSGNQVTFSTTISCNPGSTFIGIYSILPQGGIIFTNPSAPSYINYASISGDTYRVSDNALVYDATGLWLDYYNMYPATPTTSTTLRGILKIPAGQSLASGTYTSNFQLGLQYTTNGVNTISTVNAVGTFQNVASCTISSTGINFGNYSSKEVISSGTINTNCTNGVLYNVSASYPSVQYSYDTTSNARYMTNAGTNLFYQLYTNSPTSDFPNEFFTGDYNGITMIGTGSAQTLNVYGKIFKNQYPKPGVYSDSVTLTLYY